MASVKLTNVKKIYGKDTVAVQDFNLDIADKEFIVFVGPSGCGKSTTLRMIAGLEDISAGTIEIDGVVVNDLQPRDRNIAMVFQNYALYPHLTVFENMAFSLRLKNAPQEEVYEKVVAAAEILGITEYLTRKPRALSGGQRQRVAIGRAMVRDSKVFRRSARHTHCLYGAVYGRRKPMDMYRTGSHLRFGTCLGDLPPQCQVWRVGLDEDAGCT